MATAPPTSERDSAAAAGRSSLSPPIHGESHAEVRHAEVSPLTLPPATPSEQQQQQRRPSQQHVYDPPSAQLSSSSQRAPAAMAYGGGAQQTLAASAHCRPPHRVAEAAAEGRLSIEVEGDPRRNGGVVEMEEEAPDDEVDTNSEEGDDDDDDDDDDEHAPELLDGSGTSTPWRTLGSLALRAATPRAGGGAAGGEAAASERPSAREMLRRGAALGGWPPWIASKRATLMTQRAGADGEAAAGRRC